MIPKGLSPKKKASIGLTRIGNEQVHLSNLPAYPALQFIIVENSHLASGGNNYIMRTFVAKV